MKSFGIAATAALLLAGAAQAAAISTTLTMNNATIALSSDFSSATISGPVTLTHIGTGTFKASVALTSLFSSSTISVPYTITLTTGDTILGVVKVPQSVLSGSGTGSATVTGGTGAYAGSTGSFPTLAGSGSFTGTSGSLSLSGDGTITPNGGGASGPPPTITAVLDAGSYTSSIAQGSVFVVKGTNLSASGFTQLGFPLPPSSSGVSINFTPLNGGTGIPAYLVYLYNLSGVNQLAAVLPSTVAVGTYNVTVTNGGQISTPVAVQVVAHKPGLITADSTGNGLAVIQNYVSASQLDVNRFTTGTIGGFTVSPAHPLQTEIAYLVGTGPEPGPDNQASPGYNFLTHGVTVQITVGGMQITPTYEGRVAGGSGYEQVNFVLPANVQTGCTVPFQLSVNGTLSQATFIAIAPDASASACVQPGYTTSQLQNFDQGGAIYTGGFAMLQIMETVASVGTIKSDSAYGAFEKITGFELPAASSTSGSGSVIPAAGCYVTQITTQAAQVATGIAIALDAGAVTLTGPSGSNLSNTAFSELLNTYSLQIGEEGLPGGVTIGVNGKIVPGTYTVNGAGGADVGPFSVSVTLPSPLTVTGGLPTVVTRSAGLPLSWTGGNPSDLVEIGGSAGILNSSGTITNGASFICITTAGQGGFTVPASILNQLPAVSTADITANKAEGFLEVYSAGTPATFTAPLVAGGSITGAGFSALVGVGGTASYQ